MLTHTSLSRTTVVRTIAVLELLVILNVRYKPVVVSSDNHVNTKLREDPSYISKIMMEGWC
jgi:hypothetical protein